MNKERRKQLGEAEVLLVAALELVSGASSEERAAYDNLSESLQNGERGQAMSEAADALEEAVGSLDEALSRIQDASQ